MKLKNPKIIISSAIAFIIVVVILSSSGLLGFLLTSCKEVESVVLNESVDVRGKVTTTLTKTCVTEAETTQTSLNEDVVNKLIFYKEQRNGT